MLTIKMLTKRETEVMNCVSRGKTNKEIAFELMISENTVERHLKNVYKKLGARNRIEALSLSQEITGIRNRQNVHAGYNDV